MRLIIGQNVAYIMPEIIWSLSKDDSELHTSTGSETFSLLNAFALPSLKAVCGYSLAVEEQASDGA